MLSKHKKKKKIQNSNFKIWDLSTCQTTVLWSFHELRSEQLRWTFAQNIHHLLIFFISDPIDHLYAWTALEDDRLHSALGPIQQKLPILNNKF
jgi:hypothetical protein